MKKNKLGESELEVTEPLKNAMGSNADLWESPGRIA